MWGRELGEGGRGVEKQVEKRGKGWREGCGEEVEVRVCGEGSPGFQRGGASGQARYEKWGGGGGGGGGLLSASGLIRKVGGGGGPLFGINTLSIIINGYNFGRGGAQAPGAPPLDTSMKWVEGLNMYTTSMCTMEEAP